MADSQMLPPSSFALFERYASCGSLCPGGGFAPPLTHRLFMQAKDSSNLPPIWTSPRSFSGEFILFDRILPAGMPFVDLVRTRQYTRSRVSRALLHIFLDIRQEMARFQRTLVLAFAGRLPIFSRKSAVPAASRHQAAGHLNFPKKSGSLLSIISGSPTTNFFQTTYHSLVLWKLWIPERGSSSSSVHKVLAIEAGWTGMTERSPEGRQTLHCSPTFFR